MTAKVRDKLLVYVDADLKAKIAEAAAADNRRVSPYLEMILAKLFETGQHETFENKKAILQ